MWVEATISKKQQQESDLRIDSDPNKRKDCAISTVADYVAHLSAYATFSSLHAWLADIFHTTP